MKEGVGRGHAHTAGEADRGKDAQRLAAHGVEVGELVERIVGQVCIAIAVGPALGCDELRAELFLRVGVLCEEVQDAREGVGGRVHAGEGECPTSVVW